MKTAGETVNKGQKMLNSGKNFFTDHIASVFAIVAIAVLAIYEFCQPQIQQNTPPTDIAIQITVKFVMVMSFWSNYFWSGRTAGKKDVEFIATRKYFTNLYNSIVSAKRLNEVAQFCEEYIKDKLDTYIKSTIESVGLLLDDYYKYYQHLTILEVKRLKYKIGKEPNEATEYAGEKLTDRQKAHIIDALTARPIKLSEEMLIGGESVRYGRKAIAPNENQLIKKQVTSKVIRWLFTTAITTYWVFSMVASFTKEAVGALAVTLGIIATAGVGGWLAGYKLVTVGVAKNLNDRADILTIMCEKKGIAVIGAEKNQVQQAN